MLTFGWWDHARGAQRLHIRGSHRGHTGCDLKRDSSNGVHSRLSTHSIQQIHNFFGDDQRYHSFQQPNKQPASTGGACRCLSSIVLLYCRNRHRYFIISRACAGPHLPAFSSVRGSGSALRYLELPCVGARQDIPLKWGVRRV